MMTRPLSPLRNATLSVPLPAGDSFFVSQCTRNEPVSLMNVSVCMFARPDQDPRRFQATIREGGGDTGAGSQPMASSDTAETARMRTPLTDCLSLAAAIY